jgi:tripartite ATP-independent transporter DctM subunit
MTLSGGITLLLVLLALGLPIFVTFLLMNVFGVIALIGPAGFAMFANSIYTTASLGSLAAVPLFILMGEIMFKSGLMDVLFDSIDRLIGQIRGRQYVVCIVLSAVMGSLSGAAMAVAGLLGRSVFPMMRQRGYDTQLSAGTILAGASLDPIIPPSVLAIIIATLAQVSTGKMLIAGVIPGLFLAGMFLIYVLVRLRMNPKLAPDVSAELRDPSTRGSVLMALVRMLPCGFIFFLVMGLVMLGVATPTEAAATGVFGALVLAWFYGGLNRRMLIDALYSGVTVAGLLLVVMACATMFSQLLTFTGATRILGEMIVTLNVSAPIMIFIMLAVPFVLFMFLDQVALLMVLIPIYQQIIKVYGFDPIWFWTLLLIVASVGGLTPPFGYTLFAFKSAVPNLSMNDIFKAAWPFVWIIVLGLFVMAIFPSVITFLPGLMATQ